MNSIRKFAIVPAEQIENTFDNQQGSGMEEDVSKIKSSTFKRTSSS